MVHADGLAAQVLRDAPAAAARQRDGAQVVRLSRKSLQAVFSLLPVSVCAAVFRSEVSVLHPETVSLTHASDMAC